MTPLELLDALKVFIEQKTKDILLPVKVDKKSGEASERPAEVHKMRLPNKEAQTKQIPYVLLQFLNSTDTQEAGLRPESSCAVRIIVATYSEDEEEGALCVLNLLTRIRIELLKAGIIGEQFEIKQPLELIVYPDNIAPYYLGEMMTNWQMPIIEREVQKTWQ